MDSCWQNNEALNLVQEYALCSYLKNKSEM
jgi:hypothetical protein